MVKADYENLQDPNFSHIMYSTIEKKDMTEDLL